MILIDYSAISIAAAHAQRIEEPDLIRHSILNSIRLYNKKYRDQYGEVVICCDSGSWRRKYYPEYKANRRKAKDDNDASKDHWKQIFEAVNNTLDGLRDSFPYKIVKVEDAEADDIIGTLCEHTQEFGKHEDVMIISGDKDFGQLQKWNNIKQYSPITKKMIEVKNPRSFLIEHIMKGDSSDGVPNVLSDDDTFVTEGKRQTPVRKKLIESIMDAPEPSASESWNADLARNWARNEKLIDLDKTPEDIKESIINTFEQAKPAPKMKVLNFLIKNKHKLLIECVEEFYPK